MFSNNSAFFPFPFDLRGPLDDRVRPSEPGPLDVSFDVVNKECILPATTRLGDWLVVIRRSVFAQPTL